MSTPNETNGSTVAAGSDTEDELTLTRDELLRRYRVQQDWHMKFAECLDGIPSIRLIPGGGLDGFRMPDEIRRVVEVLVNHCHATWERSCCGESKPQPKEASK